MHEYGLRQLSELTPIERRRLAYHEAGHTVASYYLMDRYYLHLSHYMSMETWKVPLHSHILDQKRLSLPK